MYKRLFLVFAGWSLLAGCGGGGASSGGTGYNGLTTQAIVTTSNAKALTVDAYSGSQISAAASGVAKVANDNNGHTALLQQTAGILVRCMKSIVDPPKSSAKSVAGTAVQSSINGYSGSASFTITVEQTTGAFNGTIAFSQYQDTDASPTISGSLSFSGIYSQSAGDFTSLNITFGNFVGTDGSKSYKLAGSLSYSIVGITRTVSMSVVLTDNSSGRTFWVKDFNVAEAGNLLTVTGTYYDPINGYVVISTSTPLTAMALDAPPTSGQLLFSGANGTKARLTFSGGGSTVEADTVGNGIYLIVP